MIDEGLAAQRAGDLETARNRFEAALEQAPDHPEALHLLGLVCLGEGDQTKALHLIERAVAIDPTEPIFRLNGAAIYEKQQNFAAAAQHLRAAADAAPHDVRIRLRLGRSELGAGELEAALATFERACELDPDNIDARVGLGRAKFHAGSGEEAFRLANSALEAAPSHPGVLKLAAATAAHLRRWPALVQAASQWLSVRPGDHDPKRLLASAFFELGEMEKARDSFKGIVDAANASAEDWAAYGRYCLAAFDYHGAEDALEKAHEATPLAPNVLFGLSRLRFFLGALDESERLCRQAIEADPDFAPAYAHLAKLSDGEVGDDILEAMRRLAESDKTATEHKASLYFSIGEALHRAHAFEEAMEAVAKGNAISESILQTENRVYQPAHAEALRRREFALFDTIPEPCDFRTAPAAPIFVVGMPRSGTTLIESVLAAHPDVFGAGELAALPIIRDTVIRWADRSGARSLADVASDQVEAWRAQYLAGWPDIGDARFVVDKQPANFRAVPLIRTLFPEAPIIHIRRNPIETGFSIFRHDFGKAWPFANTLENIAHYYGEYARLMARWERLLGERMLHIQYEEFASDFESQARRLVAHCGLGWDDKCLSFHRSKRPIATFSGAQVRRPVYSQTSRAREQYGALLDPLIEGLKRAGVNLETGALDDG